MLLNERDKNCLLLNRVSLALCANPLTYTSVRKRKKNRPSVRVSKWCAFWEHLWLPAFEVWVRQKAQSGANSSPPFQYSIWEKTEVNSETPRLLADHWRKFHDVCVMISQREWARPRPETKKPHRSLQRCNNHDANVILMSACVILVSDEVQYIKVV